MPRLVRVIRLIWTASVQIPPLSAGTAGIMMFRRALRNDRKRALPLVRERPSAQTGLLLARDPQAYLPRVCLREGIALQIVWSCRRRNLSRFRRSAPGYARRSWHTTMLELCDLRQVPCDAADNLADPCTVGPSEGAGSGLISESSAAERHPASGRSHAPKTVTLIC